MDQRTDAELVEAVREGSVEPFGELVRRHQRAATALAYSLLGDSAEADDLAQEAFLRALRNLDLLADPASFGPWLRRVVFGTCIDWLRTFRPELYRTSGDPGEAERVASAAASPLERLERTELAERVLAAVQRLPPRYRVPLSMYHLEGVSQRRVAAALGVEESTVRSLLTRARQRLAPLLASYAHDVFDTGAKMADLDEVLDPAGGVPRLLHLLNGDATRWKLERSEVPGTFAVWADALHEGPVPGPEVPPERWRELRVRYHLGADHTPSDETVTYEQALAHFRGWDEALERYPEHAEVVVWLEHDLFDQLLLIRHLHWFSERDLGATRLSLICIGGFPGMPDFKGLGELSPDQLASLLETRQPVTRRQLELGRAAWRAFTAPDPTELERLLERDTAALPFLARALRRLLEEYPAARDGLSHTERQALRLLADGPRSVLDLFRAMHHGEDAFYIADASFWTVLRGLARGTAPAVALQIAAPRPGRLPEGTARITDFGRALLAGEADRVRANGIDRWLGGVHLHAPAGGGVVWRWDAERGRLVPS